MPLILRLSNPVPQIFCLYFPICEFAPENLDCKNITIQIQAQKPNPPHSGLSFLEEGGGEISPPKDVSGHSLNQPITACLNYFILNSLVLFIIFRKLLPLPRRFIFLWHSPEILPADENTPQTHLSKVFFFTPSSSSIIFLPKIFILHLEKVGSTQNEGVIC